MKAIKKALEGTEYNTPSTREAIYINEHFGFSQLYANTKIIANMTDFSSGGYYLEGR